MLIDCSNWGGNITDAQLECMIDNGLEGAIVGAQNDIIARRQLDKLRSKGIPCGIYFYPMYDGQDDRRVDTAINLYNDYACTLRVWDDIEWNGGGKPSPQRVMLGLLDRLEQLEDNDVPYGYYTSQSQWPLMTAGLMDATVKSKQIPLWQAYQYNDRRVPKFTNFIPFGPWTECIMWQYSLDVSLCGFSVDLNIANFNLHLLPEEEEYILAKLNDDGSARIVAEGNQIVIYNRNVPVLVIGDEEGNLPGQIKKLFGPDYQWLRMDNGSGGIPVVFHPEKGD